MILENDYLAANIDTARGIVSSLRSKPAKVDLCAQDASPLDRGGCAEFQNQPFDAVSSSPAGVTLAVSIPTLKLTRAFSLKSGESCLCIDETLSNPAPQERDLLWGFPVVFGAPLVDKTCRIDAPAVSYFDPRDEPMLRMRWPKLADGTDLDTARADARQLFLTDFSVGRCALENAACKLRVELHWDATLLPYCWIEERAGTISLAPSTGLPNAAEEGHGLITLPAGGTASAHFEVHVESLV